MEKIVASMVIEILGKPSSHVKEAMLSMVARLGSEKGVKIIHKEVHEPKELEESPKMFTTFAELDVELDSLSNYFGIIFAYMPSHIEISNPERISLQNHELNDLGNSLIQRLYGYDAITKNTVAERNFLLSKIKEISPEIHKKLTTPPEKQKT